MAGRDALPHFPAPEKTQRPNMYQQQGPYQYQQSSGVPGAFPAGGYQSSPPVAYAQTTQYSYSQQPPPGVDIQLYNRFRAADVKNSGQLTEVELSGALVNGDWTPFDPKTVKLMVKMFDVDQLFLRSSAH